jgi:hypothetical protein
VIDKKVSNAKELSPPADDKAVPQAMLAPERTEAIQSSPAEFSQHEMPTTEQIAALAYDLWIERGSPNGSHEEDWFHAERQLRGLKP